MTTVKTSFQPSPRLLRPRPPGRHHFSPRALIILTWCCSFFQLGCLAIPIPQGYRNLEREGKKIGETRLSFVVPGETTKAEFIERIGQPYLVLDDLGVMAYYWKMLAAYVPWAGPYISGIIEVDRQHVLLVAYDEQGIISRYEILKNLHFAGSKSKTIEELARQWAAKIHQSRNYAAAAHPVDKSVVYIFHYVNPNPLNMERANSIDGVFLDGNLWTELRMGQYTALPVSPGPHVIGFERDIRRTDKFLHPDRQNPEPFLTETIDVKDGQTYFLEVYFLESDSRDFKKTPAFSRLSESVGRPKLAGLKRAR